MAIIEMKNWAQSYNQAPISCFKSTVQPQKPLMIIGGVHGDEPEGAALVEGALSWLGSLSELEQNDLVPWILIPRLNPDGLAKNERTNGRGVDLNRNYPSKNWSPEYKSPRYFPGEKSGSEPEIIALVKLIKETSPKMIIHCHSWNPCVVYTGAPGLNIAKSIGDSVGYDVRDDIGYPTPGSLSQYGWHDNQIPIICIEEAEHTPLPQVWPRFADVIQKIIRGLVK